MDETRELAGNNDTTDDLAPTPDHHSPGYPPYHSPYDAFPYPQVSFFPALSRKAKAIACAVLAALALFSFFVLAEIASSPTTHATTIQTLDGKKDTVMGLVGASTASSTAITLIPGDAGTPIAEKLVNLSSDFLIVVAAIYLEKYLLTIIGFVAFKILVPVSCLLAIFAVLVTQENLAFLRDSASRVAIRLFVLGIAMYLVVPASVFVSNMIDQTYQESINATLEHAQETTEKIEETTGKTEKEDKEGSNDFLTTLQNIPSMISQIPDSVSTLVDDAQRSLNDFIESLAVMIVTSCVIPILVLVFFLWLVKVILGVQVNIPMQMLHPRTFKRRGPRNLTKRG